MVPCAVHIYIYTYICIYVLGIYIYVYIYIYAQVCAHKRMSTGLMMAELMKCDKLLLKKVVALGTSDFLGGS